MTSRFFSYCLPFIWFFCSGCCFHQKKPLLRSVQVVDYQGISQTISDPKRLLSFEARDPLEAHEYKQVARHYRRTKKGNLFSILTSYHPTGTIFQYLEVKNGRAQGQYREWHPNGVLHLECRVLGGIPDLRLETQESWEFDGICQSWDTKGHLEASIPYVKGKREGEAFTYYPDGNVQQILSFNQNLLHGKKKVYSPEALLLEEIEYEHDLLHGNSCIYSSTGKILSEELFEQGLLVKGSYFNVEGVQIGSVLNGSGWRFVFEKDNVVEKQEFIDGSQKGKIYFFNSKGHLSRLATYQDGLLHGEDEHFFTPQVGDQPNPPLRQARIQWYQDEIRGEVESWYENGQLLSSGTILDGEKDGTFTCYYPNGAVSLIEEYEKGFLRKGRYFRMKDMALVSSIEEGEGLAILFDENGALQRKTYYKNGHPILEEESDNVNNP
ncbi:toxin-antitoxin system YwqK family antitoxin [Candidatus Similichlamydia laticola]|uniref:Phophatidylinositol-4-phosphate 5-kinase n=1 Tax=Candidatus Similichlamydia laticola TaxID=2170265 RepID=A0A369KJK9_9BACT|nr:hypothetical protein [Candidatus Similichlamydia laticola]RDB31156.1 Phophatidylinositol-4-phosphate 5-kinase [Candidatus Similichlamydia laticola]